MKKNGSIAVSMFLLFVFLGACSAEKSVKTSTDTVKTKKIEKKNVKQVKDKKITKKKESETIVTFVELGSVNCIPCKMMQPVMKEIENEYGNKGVKVIFYDVWTAAGQPYSEKYKIRAIPTQVFLDKDGTEFYRHEGFFPKDELIKILKKGGIK